MDALKYVVDIMLPLEEYAVVSEDATVYDAFIALEEAQKKLPPDRQPHRAVLVVNKENKIVGKLGHLGFLKALEPGYKNLGQLDMISKAGLSKEFITSMMKNYGLLQDDLDAIRNRTKTIKIKDVMRPVTEHIDINDTINEAMHKIIMWQTLSVLVTKGDTVVGILRLSDLFDEVSNNILKKK
jgi:predicted transcriptional regulator